MKTNKILLCESGNQKFLEGLDGKYADSVPVIYAHRLYKFLYSIITNFDYSIQKICFINTLSPKIQKLFEREFRKYSPEINDYLGA
jgi:hypothetical protein